jgi:gluconate 2-dehydrogenase subunit 3-like protein
MPKNKWTRRRFLETGSGTAALVTLIQPATAAVFTPDERATLSAAMDEIIPAADSMPSAAQVGGLEYLERVAPQLPGLLDQFRQGLAKLDAESRKRSGQPFQKLSRADRAEVLRTLERGAAPDFFRTLRDFVYEAYYTRPEVWQRIGYELHPTDHAGPHMKPFDESVLAQVRKRGKRYREVS